MNYRKIFTCAFFAFVLCLSNIVNAMTDNAMTEAGVKDAVNHRGLGTYLFGSHGNDRGVQQFIRHTKKHFCLPRDIKDDKDNEAASTHTVLGNGNWGEGGHKNALRWILNAATSATVQYIPTNAGVELNIDLQVRDVPELLHPVENHTMYVWEKTRVKGKDRMTLQNPKGKDASDLKIACSIFFMPGMTGLRFSGKGADGTAGYCYVKVKA